MLCPVLRRYKTGLQRFNQGTSIVTVAVLLCRLV